MFFNLKILVDGKDGMDENEVFCAQHKEFDNWVLRMHRS